VGAEGLDGEVERQRAPVEAQIGQAQPAARPAQLAILRTAGPQLDGCYAALRNITENKDASILEHISPALVRKLVRGGDHVDPLRYLVIDGKAIKVHLRQEKPKGENASDPVYQAHERKMQRHRRGARWGIHKHGLQVVLKVFGYKLVTIS